MTEQISNHCYEAVDLDDIVRVSIHFLYHSRTGWFISFVQLSNEFGFHIASFHHASEAWLVPGVLNRT